VDANVFRMGDVVGFEAWLNNVVLFVVDTEELLNKSVENNDEAWLEDLFAEKVTGPAEPENRSNGTSIFGVAFLLTSFSGEVASED